jgi:hypothetical protein
LHLFTHLDGTESKDRDKLHVHYNSLKDKKSAIWKNTPAPKFQRPKGLNLKNVDDKNRLDTMEKQHAIKYETLAKEREMMRGWIRAIEEREKLNTSTQKMTEDEITKVLKEKGEE